MTSDNHLQTALVGLVDYLALQRELGQLQVEISDESLGTLRALRSAPARKATTNPRTTAMPKPKATTTTPASSDPAEAAQQAETALADVAARIAACQKCGLCQNRTNTVPGEGRAWQPDIMFIGEAPGAEEDRQGRPFVGRSGKLLTQMIAAMGYDRSEVFITSIAKCRPPDNRQPTVAEMEACLPYLQEQIAIIQPRTIVAMGNTAIQGLLGSGGISRLRGTWTSFEGIPLMPTFHPAYLLRFPSTKRNAWNDLKKVLAKLGRPVPPPAPKSEKS